MSAPTDYVNLLVISNNVEAYIKALKTFNDTHAAYINARQQLELTIYAVESNENAYPSEVVAISNKLNQSHFNIDLSEAGKTLNVVRELMKNHD